MCVGLISVWSCGESVSPSSEPPAVSITSPAATQTFAGGDVIQVTSNALDIRGAALPNDQLEWWVVFHHATHTHPFLPPTEGGSGTFTIPRQGELASDVFYRIYVRAVNDRGLADTAFVDVLPQLTQLTVVTEPAGLDVTLDHQPRTTPITVTSVVGMEWPIGVPAGQTQNGTEYEFASWSQGGAEAQTITTTGASITLTAKLRDVGVANTPPTVSVTSPPTASIVTAGTPVSITANASDANGTVAQVDFFVGSTKIGTDVTAPFTFDWTPTGTGQRQLFARATDNRGAYTMSTGVAVTVQAAGGGDGLAPNAALTSPADGTRDLSGSLNLTATATDNVGVVEVEFAVDGFSIGTDNTAPYQATLPSTSAYASGVHTLSARARDAAGNVSDWSSSVVTFSGTVPVPAGFTLAPYVTGFGDILTAATMLPDGRILVCEQGGALRLVKNGVLLPTPVLSVPVLHLGEQGLLGVVFHPDFATNHYIYVYYTTSEGVPHNRIARYVLNGDVAAQSSATTLVDLPELDVTKHNGGTMAFGGDGKLYVGVGDNEHGDNSQSLATPFGKMLRFNSDGTIPTDNPFYAQTTGLNRAIWALGLRNPFSFAIEAGTGRMHINDVGGSIWEELNLGRPGANYGWPLTEGPTTNPAFDAPLLAFRHENSPTLFDGTAIVGAAFYHPQTASFGADYVGSYFFADYGFKQVYRYDVVNAKANAFARVSAFITGLLVGPDGSLYILNGTAIDRVSR